MSDLPTAIDEAAAVETISRWIDVIAEGLKSDTSHALVRDAIRDALRKGTIPLMRVIAAAEADRDADLALREMAAEYISRREEMPTELANYAQRALMRPPVSYRPGRNFADTLTRDIKIAALVWRAGSHWDVPVSRSHSRKPNAKERLSACYLVALALNKRGCPIQERQVERIFANNRELADRLSNNSKLAGLLSRYRELADRLSAVDLARLRQSSASSPEAPPWWPNLPSLGGRRPAKVA